MERWPWRGTGELAEKRVSDHQVEGLSSDQAGRMEIERNMLEGMQEGAIMLRRNNEKKEMSDERRTSKSEKFERIFNFWKNKGDRVGSVGMLLLTTNLSVLSS